MVKKAVMKATKKPLSKRNKALVKSLKTCHRLLAKENGWIQGSMTRREWDSDKGEYRTTAFCALGVIEHVDGGVELENGMAAALLSALLGLSAPTLRSLGRDYMQDRITTWNDVTDRTKDDVLEAFAKAARLVEKGMF